jgi:hypothetical protein
MWNTLDFYFHSCRTTKRNDTSADNGLPTAQDMENIGSVARLWMSLSRRHG